MHLIGQILLGLIMVVAGVLLLKYNYQVSNSLRISFAEQHMGSGGSYLLWKIIGVVVVIAGITVVFGFSDNILAWVFSPITNVVNPSE